MEAAFIIPLFLFCMIIAIKLSVSLYQELAAEAIYEESTWGVEEFYRYQRVEELWEEYVDDES